MILSSKCKSSSPLNKYGYLKQENKNIKTLIQFSQADLIQAHKTDSYLFPSDPNKISFLGLVFVGSICTVLETDSTVTTCGQKHILHERIT